MTLHTLTPRDADAQDDDDGIRLVNCFDPQYWSERKPADLLPRFWLYGRHYLLGAVSATVADGGVGKTTLVLTEAIAIATGRNLLGIEPDIEMWEGERVRRKVIYWNGEEPHEEIDRRVFATCQQHSVDLAELDGTLEVLSGLDDFPITIAKMEHGGIVFDEHVIGELSEAHDDLIIIDPFISCHKVAENDNTAIDAVIKKWGEIASGNGGSRKSIELSHHARKPMHGETGDKRVADARGASAFIDGVRSARVLNKMTESEATRAGIKEADRWRYFRADNGKANYAAPADGAAWYRLTSTIIANGDNVGTLASWRFPGAFDNVTTAHMERVRTMAGARNYRADIRSDDWIGRAVAEVLNLDAATDRKRIKEILKGWFETGALKTVERVSEKNRKPFTFVVPGAFKEP
jgi:AAA domain